MADVIVSGDGTADVIVQATAPIDFIVSGALAGAPGDDGAPGADGTNGSVWYNGTGAPTTLHNDGDYYLRTSNGDVYQQVSNSWGSPIENLTGPAGSGSGDMTKAVYDPSAKSADAFSQDNMVDGTTNKNYSATEKTKLAGIATGATANSTDATLLARANHTGTQLAATISDFSTAADARITAATSTGTGALVRATSPALTTPTGIVKGDVGLGNVDNTSNATERAATRTLTNASMSGSGNTFTNIALGTAVIGTLVVGHGGTGVITLTGIVKGTGTSAMVAATSGTDYSAGTSALATGIIKSTTTTGALTIATGADLPTRRLARVSSTSAITSITTSTPTQITGFTSGAVTIPSSSTELEACFSALDVFGSNCFVSFWDGPVNIGTKLGETQYNQASGSTPVNARWAGTLSAGTHTINVGYRLNSTGSSTFETGTGQPAIFTLDMV